jgi:hypothetical protein
VLAEHSLQHSKTLSLPQDLPRIEAQRIIKAVTGKLRSTTCDDPKNGLNMNQATA